MKITSENFFIQVFQQQHQKPTLTIHCQQHALTGCRHTVQALQPLADLFQQWKQAGQNKPVQTSQPNQDLSQSPELQKLIQTLASLSESAFDKAVFECLQNYFESERSSNALLNLSNYLFVLARKERIQKSAS